MATNAAVFETKEQEAAMFPANAESDSRFSEESFFLDKDEAEAPPEPAKREEPDGTKETGEEAKGEEGLQEVATQPEKETPADEQGDVEDYETLLKQGVEKGKALIDEYNKIYNQRVQEGKQQPQVAQQQQPEQQQQPVAQAPPEQRRPSKQPQPGVDFEAYVAEIPKIDFSEIEDKSVRRFLQDDEDMASAVMAVSGKMVQKSVSKAVNELISEMMKLADGVDEAVGSVRNEILGNFKRGLPDLESRILKQARFDRQLDAKHPDVDKVLADEDFKSFMKDEKTPREIKALFNSNNVEHADLFLRLSKAYLASKKVQKQDQKQADKRSNVVAQLKTTRTSGRAQSKQSVEGFSSGFNVDED